MGVDPGHGHLVPVDCPDQHAGQHGSPGRPFASGALDTGQGGGGDGGKGDGKGGLATSVKSPFAFGSHWGQQRGLAERPWVFGETFSKERTNWADDHGPGGSRMNFG